jgi:hypothetical protein
VARVGEQHGAAAKGTLTLTLSLKRERGTKPTAKRRRVAALQSRETRGHDGRWPPKGRAVHPDIECRGRACPYLVASGTEGLAKKGVFAKRTQWCEIENEC